MEINEWFRLAVVSTLLSTLSCFGEEWTDDAIRQGVVRFLMPRCGGGDADGTEPPNPDLVA